MSYPNPYQQWWAKFSAGYLAYRNGAMYSSKKPMSWRDGYKTARLHAKETQQAMDWRMQQREQVEKRP